MASFTQLAVFCLLISSSLVAALPSPKSGLLTSTLEFNVDVPAATDQITFSHCTADQERTISTVIPDVWYLDNIDRNHTAAIDDRYKIWFGSYTQARFGEVIGRMAAIRHVHFEDWTYECDPGCGLLAPLITRNLKTVYPPTTAMNGMVSSAQMRSCQVAPHMRDHIQE
ncbi:hypothetical protein BDN71DRAFT_1510141 [Pleurotus eryngii]|uniref:Uncharacterized protein n=1 Tax=Pleurotus eryngii TaxID=5323 RepID=A0A9P6DDB0_PLEER|nr:hypothetical protein BDN71DRAFT_1510141 [Pleurotus eryngii]